jgi:hypothetical protein
VLDDNPTKIQMNGDQLNAMEAVAIFVGQEVGEKSRGPTAPMVAGGHLDMGGKLSHLVVALSKKLG